MTQQTGRTVMLAALVAIGSLVLCAHYAPWRSGSAPGNPLRMEIIARRLFPTMRLAKVLVLGQRHDPSGLLKTSCVFVEYAADGKTLLSARHIEVPGNELVIDTRTLIFADGYPGAGAGFKGKQATLFVRAFAPGQPAGQGALLDTPGETPDFYGGAEVQADPAGHEFWSTAWRIADDPAAGRALGVKVYRGQSHISLAADGLYDLWITPTGATSVMAEPLSAAGRDMLQHAIP